MQCEVLQVLTEIKAGKSPGPLDTPLILVSLLKRFSFKCCLSCVTEFWID